MKTCLIIGFLLKSLFLFSKESFIIEGQLLETKEQFTITLIGYKYGEVELFKQNVSSEKFNIAVQDIIEDGVYKFQARSANEKSKYYKVYEFYLIIDRLEHKIKFTFTPDKSIFPNIIKSEINQNWYKFLEVQHFRIAALVYLSEVIEVKNNSNFKSIEELREIYSKETEDLETITEDYLDSNFNKWSTAMVKNTIKKLGSKENEKNNYWKQFDTENPYWINTPLFQEIIQNYLAFYYNNANEIRYEQGLDEVVNAFSINPITKKWVVEYIFNGLKLLKNDYLISSFTVKYKS